MFMKTVIYIFIILTFYNFPSNTFSIEMSDDLFIGTEDSEDTDSDIIETAEIMEKGMEVPNIKKVYKKEKVLIKRDISSLRYAIEELDSENQKSVALKKNYNKSNRQQKSPYNKKKPSIRSVDYGDYEVHWSKGKRY